MRAFRRDVPAPGADRLMGIEVLAVPPGATITLDVRLEAVSEGVYVSGTASAPLAGECVRCLDDLTDHVTVEIGELFAYPDSLTDETTDDDELPRVVDERVDLEQTVRDALVLDLPLAPLCTDDCPGLCPECGERRAGLGPDHRHADPREAAAVVGTAAQRVERGVQGRRRQLAPAVDVDRVVHHRHRPTPFLVRCRA